MEYPEYVKIENRIILKIIFFFIEIITVLILIIIINYTYKKKEIIIKYIEYSNDLNNPIIEVGNKLKKTTNKELLIQANIIEFIKQYFYLSEDQKNPFLKLVNSFSSDKIIFQYTNELLKKKFYDPTPLEELPNEYHREFKIKKIDKINKNIYKIYGLFIEIENLDEQYNTTTKIIVNFDFLEPKEIAERQKIIENFKLLNPLGIIINSIIINI